VGIKASGNATCLSSAAAPCYCRCQRIKHWDLLKRAGNGSTWLRLVIRGEAMMLFLLYCFLIFSLNASSSKSSAITFYPFFVVAGLMAHLV
jgi:hypothetical protein